MRFLTLLLFLSSFSFLHAQHVSDVEKKSAAARMQVPAVQAINNYDIIYQRCAWNVDPSVYFISGNITTQFRPAITLNQIEFDLSDSLTVDSIIYHNTSIAFSQLPNDILQVSFPGSIAATTLDSVSVYYHGAPPSTGFGSFITSTHGSSNTPVLWTLSEPYGAKDWWPCKQNLLDKIDSIDIIVSCPSAYRAASNGVLVSDVVNGPTRVCTWKHRHPVAAYLVCFAVSDYTVYTDEVPFGSDTVTIYNYVYPEDISTAQAATPAVISQMQLYDTLFGAYPFTDEKYGHCEFGWGGGMEHQTMTFVGNFSYELLSHELAHHWFGDKVTCGSWHDIWLNEGFASYLSGLCYEHFSPQQYWIPFKAGRISYITSQPDGSVYCGDTTNVSRIFDDRLSYAKGAMILHTLRWVIGDSAFYAGVNAYLTDPALAYRFATTADLQQHLENASGQNLGWYFNDWFYGEGYPSYTITWSEDANHLATFTVQQTQSHPSVSYFELPLPVRFKNATQDTLVRVSNTFSGQTFSVQLSFAADSLIFDPDLWIISAPALTIGMATPEQPVFHLSPNPVHEMLQLTALPQGAILSIYDAQGRLVRRETARGGAQRMDTATLSNGLYTITVATESTISSSKFVKE